MMTVEVTIEVLRNPSEDDRNRIRTLIDQLASHPVEGARIDEHLESIVSDADSALFVARAPDGNILGMALMTLLTKLVDREARLDEVVVDEAARGQGLGRTLVEAATNWAWEQGADVLEFSSRPHRVAANRLYQSMGFAQKETNVYRAVRPD